MKTALIVAMTMLAGLSFGYAYEGEYADFIVMNLVLVVVSGLCGYGVQNDRV